MTTEIRRLFLIEDDVALAKILALHLRSAGFDVTVFHRGDTGLEALVGTPPDLAILDVMLPGMDGLEVLREVLCAFRQEVAVHHRNAAAWSKAGEVRGHKRL